MCNVGNIILNSVLTFASVWIVRKFLDTFYEKKRWNVLSVSVWSIYMDHTLTDNTFQRFFS